MPNATIDRRCHWLRKNKSDKRPEILVFVDVESDLSAINEHAEEHAFRLGWACACRYTRDSGLRVLGWHKIVDPVSFWDTIAALAAQHKETYIVSHNIDYDARVLRAFSILPATGWDPAYMILANSCRFFSFQADKNRINLLDNMNYWQLSLAELGKEFGITKMDVNFDTCTDDELSVYCHRDVEILVKVWQFWLEFLDEQRLGDWAITTAGQAWNAYRHRFMPCKIGIHNRKDAIDLERDAYKGGRCEVLKVGDFPGQQFYKLDVNGLYAYCMQNYEYPQKLVKVIVDVTPQYLSELLERYLAVADVIVNTDEAVYCIQLRGFNVFPVGTFRVTLTTHELQYAIERNHLVAIGQVAIYEKAPLFKRFIEFWTPLRQQYKVAGDTGRSLLCKMVRNSLYGKFGQRGYKQSVIADADRDKVAVTRWIDAETGQKCVDWTFGGKTIRQVYTGEGKDSFPAVAAHVAANGRLVLWDYMQKCGLGNIWYVDTDSLIVNQAGYDNLAGWIDPVQLGCLKIEGTATDLVITAKKSYQMGDKRVLKGIRKNAVQQADGRWAQTQFTSLKWAFSHGDLDNVLTYEVKKQEHGTLYHGMVDEKGNVTPPLLGVDVPTIISLVTPQSHFLWTWWVEPFWLGSLNLQDHYQALPRWLLRAESAPEASSSTS